MSLLIELRFSAHVFIVDDKKSKLSCALTRIQFSNKLFQVGKEKSEKKLKIVFTKFCQRVNRVSVINSLQSVLPSVIFCKFLHLIC